MRIETLDPRDYSAAGALFAAAMPHRAEEIEGWAHEVPATVTRRWAAVDDAGRLIAYAALSAFRGERFRMDLVVEPESRREGIGTAMLDLLMAETRVGGGRTLQARTEDWAAGALRFLEQRGFRETMRMYRQELRPSDVVPLPNDDAPAGIAFTTLGQEMARWSQWEEELRDLYEAVREGWPDPDPTAHSGRLSPVTIEELRQLLDAFPRDSDGFLLATHDGRYVGFTGSIGTGVRPAYRGRGLATALKRRLVTVMQARGVEVMHTSTGNPAMLRANKKVGYRTVSAEVRLVAPV